MRTLVSLALIWVQVDALRIDTEKLCPSEYDITGFENQTATLEKARLEWRHFRGIDGIQGQIATYQNKPVFKVSGATLSEHLRSCSLLGGTSIEFMTAEQQEQVNQIMRKQRLEKIMIYITYVNGQLLWPGTGAAFQYSLLDSLAETKEKAKQYKGMVQYKSFDKSTKREVNEFQFISDVGSTKSLCVGSSSELYQEIARFKSEARSQAESVGNKKPTITELVQEITVQMASSEDNQTEHDKGSRKCWSILVNPIRVQAYEKPP